MKDGKSGRQFIFVAMGAAFGLGNVMRFPALCLYYGGAFVIAYVIVLSLFALPLLCAELNFGARANKFSLYLSAQGRFGGGVRNISCLNSSAIVVYYITIISLLAVRACTFYGSINVGYPSDIPQTTPLFAALCCCALAFALTRGAHSRARLCALTVCMQTTLFGILAIKGLSHTDSLQSLEYIFRVQNDAFADIQLWSSALGQALLSLSLAAGAMPCFACEMKGKGNPARFAAVILCANFFGGILSSIATLSLAYSCGMLGGISGSGIDNAFNIFPAALSTAFGSGHAAGVAGTVFYAVLALTAFVSAASLARPLFVLMLDKLSQRNAAITLCACIFALGLPFALGADYSLADYVCCNVVAPVIGVCECACFVCAALGRRKSLNVSRRYGKRR